MYRWGRGSLQNQFGDKERGIVVSPQFLVPKRCGWRPCPQPSWLAVASPLRHRGMGEAMILYLMRHGQTMPTPEAGTDAERALSEDGRAEVRGVAAGLKRLGLSVDVVLTSPVLRAWQTAEVLSSALGVGMEVCVGLLPEQDVETLMNDLALRADGRRLLLVGHQPCLERMLGVVLRTVELPVALSPAGVIWLELPEFPPHWRGIIRGVFPADVLCRLGGA